MQADYSKRQKATVSSNFAVTVDYNISVEDALRRGKYTYIDDISSDNFPPSRHRRGIKKLSIQLVHFSHDVTKEQLLEELKHKGLRAAELRELLALGEQYPDIQRQVRVLALGSVWMRIQNHRSAPFLSGSVKSRSLFLMFLDRTLPRDCWFAAVRR